MTYFDIWETVNIEISRASREAMETPYARRVRILTDAGLTEIEAERLVSETMAAEGRMEAA